MIIQLSVMWYTVKKIHQSHLHHIHVHNCLAYFHMKIFEKIC